MDLDLSGTGRGYRIDIESNGNTFQAGFGRWVPAHHLGVVSRHDQVRAECELAWLPNMATEEFLGCLSMAALNEAAMASDVARFDRAKDTRAAICRAFKERTYVHPQARFALSTDELEAERRRSVQDPSALSPEEVAYDDDAGGEAPTGERADDNAGRPEADEDPIAA